MLCVNEGDEMSEIGLDASMAALSKTALGIKQQRDELAEALRAIIDDEVNFGDHATQALIRKSLIAKGRAVLAKLK